VRILMVVAKHPFPVIGGLERQAHELSRELAKRSHQVRVLTSRYDVGQHKIENIDGVEIHRTRWIENRAARFVLLPFSLAVMMIRLGRKADVVHVHNISWFGAFVTVCAKAMGLPVVTKIPNSGGLGVPGMRARMFGQFRISLLLRSDAIAVLTIECLEEVLKTGYPRSRTLRIANGISIEEPSPPRARSVSTAPITVVFVGSLVSQKGLSDLLRSWPAVIRGAAREVRLRVIGMGPQASEFRAQVSSLLLDDCVDFAGYSGNVPAELANADLLVLPSYGEGNSNAVLEAMRAGLPIVATRVGGIAYQVGPTGEPYLVNPGDCEALASGLLRLVNDDDTRGRVGRAMRERVMLLFSIRRVAESYEKAYGLLVDGNKDELGELPLNMF
jgi:glycosyltransferase involved in cell wall biosynthesis